MCGSYVHGYTNWSTGAFATFYSLALSQPHTGNKVHFDWLGSNSKVQGGERGGDTSPLLQPPEDADPKSTNRILSSKQ